MLVRSLARTDELRATADRIGVAPRIGDGLVDPERATAVIRGADVVISTLPGGAADPLRGAGPGTVLLDVIYAPWPTPFAAAAPPTGRRVCSGLEVLLQQAVDQVRADDRAARAGRARCAPRWTPRWRRGPDRPQPAARCTETA